MSVRYAASGVSSTTREDAMSVHYKIRFRGGGVVEEVPADVDDQVAGPLYGQALARLWPHAERVAAAAGVRGLGAYSADEHAAVAAALGFEDPENEEQAAQQERAFNEVGPWHPVAEAVGDLDEMMEALRRQPDLVPEGKLRDGLRNELLSLKLVLLHAEEGTKEFRLTAS